MNAIGPIVLALTLIPLLAACAQKPLKSAEPSTSYFQDARLCHNDAQETIKIKINPAAALGSKYDNAHIGGGVADIPIHLGPDPSRYRVCMEDKGWKTDPAKDPYIAAIDSCQKAAAIPVTATAEKKKGAVRINSSFDNVAFEECLQNQGIDGTVIVHPIKPVAPR